jgi:hypothetical protein
MDCSWLRQSGQTPTPRGGLQIIPPLEPCHYKNEHGALIKVEPREPWIPEPGGDSYTCNGYRSRFYKPPLPSTAGNWCEYKLTKFNAKMDAKPGEEVKFEPGGDSYTCNGYRSRFYKHPLLSTAGNWCEYELKKFNAKMDAQPGEEVKFNNRPHRCTKNGTFEKVER